MLHQLANLPDNELMARARKLKDEEAAGILLDRYSHLLAAVSLPSLNNYDNTPEEFFPSLLKRLFKSLHTQTIPKIGEWMQFFIKSQSNRESRNTYYFPTSASSDITRLENKADKANSNLLQRKELNITMKAAFEELDSADKDILKEFYFDQKTFAEIAAEREYTMDKIRKMIKKSKQELASLIIEKLEHAKVSRHEKSYGRSEEEEVKTDHEVDEVKADSEVAEVKLEYAPADNEGQPAALVVKKVTTRKQKQVPAAAVENATAKKQKEGPTLIVEKATSKKQKQGPGLVLETTAPKKRKQGPALILVSAQSEPATDLVLEETATPAAPTQFSDIQEQDINQGYATSRKQGQDIKDLQQGSLF